MKICFDAGHGGKDPGAVGYRNSREKDNVLAIALIAGEIAENNGFEVLYTRDQDVFVGLHERANMANKSECDLFISIHNNSFTSARANGLETWSYPGSEKSKELSVIVQKEMVGAVELFNRGNKYAKFTVLKYTNMPAILVECGFISNPKEEKLMGEDEFRKKIAEAIVKGICEYSGKEYKGIEREDTIVEDQASDNEVNINELVLEVQKLLNKYNIRDYEEKSLVEDGIFGKRTETSIENLIKYIKK